jgi:hypothetical protein
VINDSGIAYPYNETFEWTIFFNCRSSVKASITAAAEIYLE